MSLLISLITAFALVVAAGAGVVALLAPEPLRLGERLALSWLTGSMVVSVGLWLGSLVCHGLVLQGFGTLLCLGLGAVAFIRRRSWRGGRLTRTELVLWALLFLEFAAVFYGAFKHTLGWDGLLNWEIKARIAYENGGALPAAYLSNSQLSFSHQEYPLGIPNLELWCYFWMGEANQFYIKAIFPMFYAAGVTMLASLVGRLCQNRLLGLSSALLVLFVPQFVVNPGAAITGYVDFPLGIFYLGAIGFLLLADRDESWFWLAAFFLTFLPWLKREGIVMWATGGACALLFRRRRSLGKAILGASGGLLLFTCWQAYLLAHHVSTASDFTGAEAESLWKRFDRFGPLLNTLWHNLLDIQSWSLLWYGAAAAVLIVLWRARTRSIFLILFAIVIPVLFDVTIYLFSGWADYLRHANLSLSRLLIQVAPVVILLVSLASRFLLLDLTKSGGASKVAAASSFSKDAIGRLGRPDLPGHVARAGLRDPVRRDDHSTPRRVASVGPR
ncbi:MAG: hypothetical protein ACREIF_16170 [Chthoniobacterales bacterium]